jgi:hypothetical protein
MCGVSTRFALLWRLSGLCCHHISYMCPFCPSHSSQPTNGHCLWPELLSWWHLLVCHISWTPAPLFDKTPTVDHPTICSLCPWLHAVERNCRKPTEALIEATTNSCFWGPFHLSQESSLPEENSHHIEPSSSFHSLQKVFSTLALRLLTWAAGRMYRSLVLH